MDVESVKQMLEGTLNASAVSPDSLYGLLIVIVVAYLVVRGIRKVTSSVGSVIGFILFLEVAHILAFNTVVGQWAPIAQEIFKYDVFTAIAQLFVGTPVADFLLYTQAWLNTVMLTVVDRVLEFINAWNTYAAGAA